MIKIDTIHKTSTDFSKVLKHVYNTCNIRAVFAGKETLFLTDLAFDNTHTLSVSPHSIAPTTHSNLYLPETRLAMKITVCINSSAIYIVSTKFKIGNCDNFTRIVDFIRS
jgi:hypothetical protein